MGETKRHLKTRVAEHGQQSRLSHIKSHNNCCSSRTFSKCNISEFKIIGKHSFSNQERKILESIYIKELAPCINKQLDFKETLFIFG